MATRMYGNKGALRKLVSTLKNYHICYLFICHFKNMFICLFSIKFNDVIARILEKYKKKYSTSRNYELIHIRKYNIIFYKKN